MLKPFRTFALLLALLIPALLLAQPAPSLPENADVRLIVDISGSMKQTDPDNLRQPAVRLLAGMLPEGSTAGLWTFGQYVNMLVPHDGVNEQWRNTVRERSTQINSIAQRTNLGEAIRVASEDYYTGGSLENTHFILLTDGKVDISPQGAVNQRERQRILQELIPALTDRGATFHSIALSEAADTGMLRKLSDSSGGSYALATSAEQLNRIFLKALNAAVPQEQLPIEGDGFVVDSGVKEFTALIFKGPGAQAGNTPLALIDPNGDRRSAAAFPDNTRWASEQAYDLITVKAPTAGQWRIDGELGEGSRVTVVSDLRMVVSEIPTSFNPGNPVDVQVAFYEEERQLLDPDFLGLLRVTLTLTSPDGRSGTKELSGQVPPENGLFSDQIGSLPAPGEYDITVLADGHTFSRKFSASMRFEPPSGEAVSDEPALPTGPVGPIDLSELEEPGAVVELEAEAGDLNDQGEPSTLEAEETGGGSWALIVGAIAAAVLALGGGALFWFLRRKKADADDEPVSDTPLADAQEAEEQPVEARESLVVPDPAEEPEPPETPAEPEEEPEKASEMPEMTEEPDDAAGEPEEKVPEIEPEPEPEPEPDEDDWLSEPEKGESDELDEFGLEDFDLSEFDDLPEEGEEDDADADASDDNEKNKSGKGGDGSAADDDKP